MEKFEYGFISMELQSSFLSRITFWWYNKFAIFGSKNDLTIDDLYDLNYDIKSEYIENLWETYWTPCINKYFEDVKKYKTIKKVPLPSVVLVCFKMFKYDFFIAGVNRFLCDILQFADPIFLKLMINLLSDENSSSYVGIFYCISMFIVSEIRSICKNYYYYVSFTLGTKIQTALTFAVYKKSLKLSNIARKEKTVGEIVNIMAIDIEKLQLCVNQIHQYWANPLQLLLVLVFLVKTLKYFALSGIIVMFLLVILTYLFSTFIKKNENIQTKIKDERIKILNEILNGIKVIKLYAWENPILKLIEKIRIKEICYLKNVSVYRNLIYILSNSYLFVVPLLTFATFTLTDASNILTPQVAFVSLTLFNLMETPTILIVDMIEDTVKVIVSNERIKQFLTADEYDDDIIFQKDYLINNKNKNLSIGSISIEECTLSWDSYHHNLSKINLNIEKGSLVMIIGKVGSGKSSLLSGILKEMSILSGMIKVNGLIAYFPQQAWIQNMSLRDNILFCNDFNYKLYQKVVECCALVPDINILPNGDQTEIGERGINMSGGQKARISLARAVYSNSDIYLLDDPLSAVDCHVGKHIFDKVLGNYGILKNKTRVLVTSNVNILEKADLIIMMEDGRIIKMGKYDNLVNDKTNVFNDFIMSVKKEKTNDEEFNLDSINIDNNIENKKLLPLSRINSTLSSTSSIESRDLENEKTNSGNLIKEEHIDRGRVKKEVYLKYFKTANYQLVLLFFLGIMAYSYLQLGRNIWLTSWSNDYNNNIKNETTNNYKTNLYNRITIYALYGIVENVVLFFSTMALIYLTVNTSKNLHTPIFYNIMKSPMLFFDTTPIGRILNRFGKDIDIIDRPLPQFFSYFINSVGKLIVTLTIINFTIPILIIFIIPLFFVYGFILKLYILTSGQLKRLLSVNTSLVYSHFSESIQGTSIIRGFGKIIPFIEKLNYNIDRNMKIHYLRICGDRWLGVRLEFIGNCVLVIMVIICVIFKEINWITNSSLIALAITYSLGISETLNFLVRELNELEKNVISVERLLEYSKIETEPELNDKNIEKYCTENWPNNGEIIFKNYSMKYRSNLDLVLKNINIHIKGGERVGLIGRTGSGKSSLTLALFRIIDPIDGNIFIDGVDIAKVSLHNLRNHITIIPQDPVVFSGTIRFNLDPFNNYSDSQIWLSLEKSNLKDFFYSKNEGLDFIISESGSNLSVGTCQLICLARAILRKSKIIVLDEATSAIDYHTDQLIQNTIKNEFLSSTVIAIAHRLNTVMNYDKIIVLNEGKIVEFDTPSNLLKNHDSLFFSMIQSGKLKEK
ncbi:ATP-binding cassette sub-family C member 8 [Strongyloides ratti]|uniref:ATP-binding cassette sub-family C member 8 n=1 Tax=Strongyloides ratti TaxID=34506 RepID=A0A090N0Q6_STRRB|nr:ATP-binding cassette sub-family C member 8 [Strongyloides ratti]CEF71103.1 ATP-binding cassette sub-family C member 8 [Strongyloides ratti]